MSKDKVKKLMSERDKIDGQLKELTDLLKSQGVDMKSPLVDEEGFPIASLDILSIRKARNSVICLNNDRKQLTDEIESLLVELHENARNKNEEIQTETNQEKLDHRRSTNRPFLRVQNVVYGSPAYYSGLQIDDLVIQCGPLHADNFNGLQHLAQLISEHVGKSITLTVFREARVHRLTAQPGKWEGVGVFGARFNVVQDFEI